MAHVNYDDLAPHYDGRYAVNPLDGVAALLASLAHSLGAERILEVGCGTGRWLEGFRPRAPLVVGLDLSPGMLAAARTRCALGGLVCGRANRLPFAAATFDLLYCVNALHHFDEPQTFVREARRLLRPGGALAVVGMDVLRTLRDQWFIYQYFEGTREADLARFPSEDKMRAWLTAAGFSRIEAGEVDRILRRHAGREVLADYFLQKHSTSQLALLSDEAYAAGLKRIEAALAEAEATGRALQFTVDITLTILTACAPELGDQVNANPH